MRLEAKIKSGFYPLSLEAVAHLVQKLQCHPSATVFDPCSGRAEAVLEIARQLSLPASSVYATEMDEERFAVTQASLGANAFGPLDFLTSGGSGTASLFYCNPPFDDELGGGGRVEWRFLSRAHEFLVSGGVLMAIVPSRVATDYRTFEVLSPWFHTLQTATLPIECKYNEQAIFGIRRKSQAAVADGLFDSYRCEFSEIPLYEVPRGGSVTVRKRFFTPPEMIQLSANSPANEVLRLRSGSANSHLVPPMRLTQGHIALLLASGFLDGVVEVPGQEPHVVRGSTRKVLTEKKSQEGQKVKLIKTEQIQLTVKVVTSQGVKVLEDQISNVTSQEEQSDDQAESQE